MRWRITGRVGLLLLLLTSLASCGKIRVEETPEELLGVWRTDAPRYRDRFTEFTSEHMIVGTGGGEAFRYELNGFRVRQKNEELDLTVYYLTEGGENSWSLQYVPEGGGVLKETKRDIAWRRGQRP